ncbi:MAG: hypothetical protein ACI8X5_001105 [Planctomycetota bacterium]|jgi:hypothetical protein
MDDTWLALRFESERFTEALRMTSRPAVECNASCMQAANMALVFVLEAPITE